MGYTITQEDPTERLGSDEYSMGQLCEVAFITGSLKGEGKIVTPDYELSEMYANIYIPVLTEWCHGIRDKIFINEEEEGYVGAYAQRRLTQLYGVDRGYGVFESEYMNGALHIERDDSIMKFKDDEEASVQAEKDGIKLIKDLPITPGDADFGYYIDTPENRKIIKEHLEGRGFKYECSI